MRWVSVALMLAAVASAQVTAPLLGWLPEGTRLRPMNGLAPAATLGPAANVGHALAHAAVSPSQNYVLANDALTGEVLLVVPRVSAISLNTPARPDQIVTSARGSSAALWFSGAAQFEILSGLPGTPAVREVDASAISRSLNPGQLAIAVSDDGQSIAAASSAGVYQWGTDGVPHLIYNGGDALALAFFAGNSNVAIATSTQLLAVSGSGTSVLSQGSFSPAGVATSFDNQEVVLADQNGSIYSINASTHAQSVVNCQCRPLGVFGLGGEIFRLTGSTVGPVKLFDAGAGAIFAVPDSGVKVTRPVVRTAQDSGTLPTLTINLSPRPTGYLQQPAMTITASSASPVEIDGNVTLTFGSNSTTGGTDQTIQFSTGSTTVNFTIPAGSTQANFSGKPSVTFSTGTVAGTTTLTANLTAPTAASAVATLSVTTNLTFPVVSSVQLAQVTGGVNVVVTGYSPTDDVFSVACVFALTSNATLTANDISVPLSPEFQTWYANTASYATGSEFTVTVPFTVTGNPKDMVGVTVTLINSKGASNPVSSQ